MTRNNFYHITKAYAFSLGNELSCTRSPQGESSLAPGLPGAAISPTEGKGRERKALAPSAGTQYGEQASPQHRLPRGRESRAPTFRRARHWALSAASRPQPHAAELGEARPEGKQGPGRTEPPQAAPVSGRMRGSGVSLSGPPRRGRLPCPPRDSPFAAAILFPASAATAPRTEPRPGPSHPLVQAPHPQLHQPLGALPVAILSVPPSSTPAPPPRPAAILWPLPPSLSPWPCTAFPASAHHRSAQPAQPTWPDRRGPPDRPCPAGGAASGTARGGWKPMGSGGLSSYQLAALRANMAAAPPPAASGHFRKCAHAPCGLPWQRRLLGNGRVGGGRTPRRRRRREAGGSPGAAGPPSSPARLWRVGNRKGAVVS